VTKEQTFDELVEEAKSLITKELGVGLPEALRLLDEGKLAGTILEERLHALRWLAYRQTDSSLERLVSRTSDFIK
jgi:hypothetical protein